MQRINGIQTGNIRKNISELVFVTDVCNLEPVVNYSISNVARNEMVYTAVKENIFLSCVLKYMDFTNMNIHCCIFLTYVLIQNEISKNIRNIV